MSEQDVEIHGVVEPGFERIREAFAANFSHHGELGPEAGIAFGYVMNQMKLGTTGDERSETLVVAAYDCLGT